MPKIPFQLNPKKFIFCRPINRSIRKMMKETININTTTFKEEETTSLNGGIVTFFNSLKEFLIYSIKMNKMHGR